MAQTSNTAAAPPQETDPNFVIAVAIVLEREGVLSSDDAGGETVYGIARKFHPQEPWPPTRARAIEIYKSEYFDRYHCGALPLVLGVAVFDGVVNQADLVAGPGHSVIQLLQAALKIPQTGIIDQTTIHAAEHCNVWDTFALFMARRAVRYATTAKVQFEVGLCARLFRVEYDLAKVTHVGRA